MRREMMSQSFTTKLDQLWVVWDADSRGAKVRFFANLSEECKPLHIVVFARDS
ncbi:hypothetical protein [Pseudomonas mohnii]